jgi:hypothetical protein
MVTRVASVAAPLIAGLLGAAACSSGQTVCDCVPPGLDVSVPPESALAAGAVVPSGPACAGASVACAKQATGGCATFHVTPSAAGNCHIDVYFPDGTHDAQDVSVVQKSGCCAGLYPDPPSAGQVAFPGPTGDGGTSADG